MSEGEGANFPSKEESERDKASASQGEVDPLSSGSVATKVEKFGGSSYLSRGFQQVCGVASQIVKVGSSNLVHTAPSTLSKTSASAPASSSHSTADQSTTAMASADTTREFLALEVSHFDQIEGNLRALMKKKDAEPSQIQVQLQLLRAKLEDVNITRQGLIRLLLDEKKTTESSKEKQDQYGLIEKLMTIELEINALEKNPPSADGVTTPVVDVEAQLYIKASETMEHHLDYLEEKLNNEVREECEDQMDVALLRWEYFQQRYKDRAAHLKAMGGLKELEKLEDRRIDLKQKKVELERKYCAFMGVESVPTTTGESSSSAHHEYSSDLRALRHDRKDLPKLGGNVKDWLPFWSLFEEVDSDKKLSNIRKFQLLLKSTVEGSEARAIVDSYTVSGKNYKAALQHLEDLYGRESVLIKVYVRELLQISLDRSMGKKTELRQLVTAITAQIRNLEMLGATEDKTALVIYPMVETCLPSHVLSAWQHDPNYSGDDLGLLMAFLQQEVSHEMERNLAKFQFQSTTFEKKNPTSESKKVKGSSERTPTAVSFHNSQKRTGCIFCEGRHPSKECRKSKNMDFEEKSERVKKGGACFVCLEVGHMSRSCPNREQVKCSVCEKPHFSVLCRRGGGQSSSDGSGGGGGASRSRNSSGSSSEGSPGNQSPPQPSAPPVEVVDFKNSIDSPDVPLQILILKVKGASGRTRVVRALLDSGSQKSYVVEELHRELQFSKIGEEEVAHHLFGGNTTAPQKHEVVKLHVTGVVEEAPCAFDVSCVPTISDNIPAARGGPWIAEFQRRGVVLQPQMESTRIELLIGNDVAPRLYTGRKEDLGTGPVALETRWGWVLCGKLPPSPHRTKNSSMVNITTTLTNLSVSSPWDLDALSIKNEATRQNKNEVMRPVEWRHALRTLNPADLPCRECSKSKVVESKWWLGSDRLHHPEESLSKTVGAVIEEAVVVERTKTVVTSMVTTSNPTVEKFRPISSYPRMINSVGAWVRKRLLVEPSRISKMRPFLDQKEVWRTKTRPLQEEEASVRPIILKDVEEVIRGIGWRHLVPTGTWHGGWWEQLTDKILTENPGGHIAITPKRMAASREWQPGDVEAVGAPSKAVYRYRIRTRGGILERPPQHLFPMECAEVAVQQPN